MGKPLQMYCVYLSSDMHDIGSQRCRVGRLAFESLSLAIGGFAQLSLGVEDGDNEPRRRAVCRVFLRKDNFDGYVNVDDTVSCGKFHLARDCQKSLISVTPLKICKMATLDVIVVVTKNSLVNRFKSDACDLDECVRELLTGFGVKEGFCVNCKTRKSAVLLGITTIKVIGAPELRPGQIVVVSNETSINISAIISQERFNQANTIRTHHKLAGLEHTQNLLKEAVLPLQFPKASFRLGLEKVTGTLLVGESGTGKSSLVYNIANDCNAEVVHISGSDLGNPHPGESEKLLREVFDRAIQISEDTGGFCILFLDNLESIGSRRTQETYSNSSRLLAQLLTLLDGVKSYNKLIVIGATNKPSILDVALRRPGRFDREITVGLPNEQERLQILTTLTTSFPLCEDVDLKHIAEYTCGYSGADLALLCQQFAVECVRTKKQRFPNSTFYSVVCNFRPSIKRSCSYLTSDLKPVNWADIGGLEDVKRQLKQLIELPLQNQSLLQRLGLPNPKGVLLYGPPGCCKTTLVRAVATDISLPFFSIGPAQIYSPFVGDSEKAITEVFQKARSMAPSILFLDEIDALVGNRSTQQNRGVHEKILSVLLNEMDGIGIQLQPTTANKAVLQLEGSHFEATVKQHTTHHTDKAGVFVVAATNRPDLLDKALLRPGRFDKILYIPAPTYSDRCFILQSITKAMPLQEVDFNALALETDCFSGADLENLCREAALLAIRENGVEVAIIHHHHFQDCLSQLRPSLSVKQLDMYEKMKRNF